MIDIQLNRPQAAYVSSTAAYTAIIAGRGTGKTMAGMMKVFLYLLNFPGAVGMATEPIASQLDDFLMREVRKVYGEYEGVLWALRGSPGNGDARIDFQNGSVLYLRAGQTPQRMAGYNLSCLWMDEAATSKGGSQELTFLKASASVRDPDHPNWIGITTTPEGHNWLYGHWFEDGKVREGYEVITGTPADNLHNLAPDFIERHKDLYGESSPRYRREILGELVEMGGLVLDRFNPDRHVRPFPEDVLWVRRIAGIDFGAHSPTAIVELRMNSAGQAWGDEALYEWGCSDEALLRTCESLRQSGVHYFACDPSAKDRIEWLQRMGIPAYKAESNLLGMRVAAVNTRLARDGLFLTPRSVNTVQEFANLSWAEGRGADEFQDRFNQRCLDHGFDGTAYGCMELDAVPTGWKAPKITEWCTA